MPIDYETLIHEPARRMDEEKPMTPTPEEIALAKEIADKFHPKGKEGLLGATWLLSYYAALEAFIEVRERG